MSKQIIYIGLLITLIFSCEGDISLDYEFSDLTLENAENMGEQPVVNSLDSIPAAAYVIRMNLFPVEVSRSRGRYFDTETPPNNVNRPTSIKVSANIDFDLAHPAGSSLNNYFVIFNHSYMHTSPLDDPYITNRYAHLFYEEPMPKYADLLLMQLPEHSDDFIFTVEMELMDGASYSKTTEIIRIYR
ncbi:MAG: DUF5034 domain-containing protein [Crocinitomix sp.]|nr:DUF5034 domain-containing protein [Crocinitomix sp.]